MLNTNRRKQVILGRRTGRDVKAGKQIRILEDGFENFSDYWTDTGSEESSLSLLKENSMNKRSTITRKKDRQPLKSMSPLTPSDHDLTESLLKKLNESTRSCRERVTSSIKETELTDAELAHRSETEHQDVTLRDDCADEQEAIIAKHERNAQAAKESIVLKDSVLHSSRQRVPTKSTLITEGNAVGSFSKNSIGGLHFPPTEPNSALLSFKTKKRLTYSGQRLSDEQAASGDSKSNEGEEPTANKENTMNDAGRLLSQKNSITDQGVCFGDPERVDSVISDEPATTEEPSRLEKRKAATNYEDECDNFMCLEIKSTRTSDQLERELSSPVSPAKPPAKRNGKRRRRVTGGHLDGGGQKRDDECMLGRRTIRRGTSGEVSGMNQMAENDPQNTRCHTTHSMRESLTKSSTRQDEGLKSARSKADRDGGFQLRFDFADTDDESELASSDCSGFVTKSSSRKSQAVVQREKRKANNVKSTSHQITSRRVTKKGRQIKQTSKVSSHSHVHTNGDSKMSADEDDGHSDSGRPQKKTVMNQDLNVSHLDNSSSKVQNHSTPSTNTVQLLTTKKRPSQQGQGDGSDLKASILPKNINGQKERKRLRQSSQSNGKNFLPDEYLNNLNTDSETSKTSNICTDQKHTNGVLSDRVQREGSDEPAVSPCNDDPAVSPCHDEPAVSPCHDEPAVSPCHDEPAVSPCHDGDKEQHNDVYSFCTESEPAADKPDDAHLCKSTVKRSKDKNALLSCEVPNSPGLSPIGPASCRYINDSLSSDVEDVSFKKHGMATLRKNSRKHMTASVVCERKTETKSYQHRALKSILKMSQTSMASPASAVHYCEVTQSQTPAPLEIPKHDKQQKEVKIIVPDPCPEGLRRSQRTRVRPLDWFRNERIRYTRTTSGLVVAGIESPKHENYLRPVSRKEKLEHLVRKRKQRMRAKVPKTPQNLSVHQPLPEEWQTVETSEVPVLDPTTQEEVLIDCIATKKRYNFRNVYGDPAGPDDPLILCKSMIQPAFSLGQLILRPLEEKSTQYVRNDSMIFIIKKGKVAVTIHKTTSILEIDDTFFIPRGNTYSIKNLRGDEAKFWFCQLKG